MNGGVPSGFEEKVVSSTTRVITKSVAWSRA
jgi:hypothetical protein